MRVLLGGLWTRRWLNAAALLMTVTALAAAVLGPMYAKASAEHLVDSRIASQPHYATGLSLSLSATEQAQAGGLEDYEPMSPSAVVDEAASVMSGPGVDRFWGAETRWLRDPGHTMRFNDVMFMVPLYWREDVCALAAVTGRCPQERGEVLVQETMAATMGVAAGDTLELGFEQLGLVTRRVPGGHEISEESHDRVATFTVVGTYRIEDPGSAQWFDDSRFAGFERLDASKPTGGQAAAEYAAPALLVAPASMTSQSFVGGVDRVVRTSAIDVSTMGAAETALEAFVDRALNSRAVNPVLDQQLGTIFEDVRVEHELLNRVMVAALAPLVVLSLLLLFALVSAGAAVRRPYVALAKLRGHTRGQVFRFAVGEPFLVVALAVPLAVALAVGAAHVVAARWLTPGIPVTVDAATVAALVLVTLAAAGASVVAALEVLREPLSRALASSMVQRSGSRTALVLRAGVVAVALAVVLQLLTSGDQSGQLLALLAPTFIALAVAVGGSSLLRVLSRRWVRRTAVSGSTPSYLAARRLARRPDLANLMVPLLLAVSVITFAGSAAAVSDDWRVSRARAEVGAAQTFRTDVSPSRLLHVTREVDPQGRHLAAAVAERAGDQAARRLLVDSTRLTAVSAWDPSWSSVPLARIAARLDPHSDRRLSFVGRTVSVTLREVSLDSATGTRPSLWLQYVNDDGEQRTTDLGRVRNARGEQTLTGLSTECAERCLVEKIFLAGDNLSVLDADGTMTLTRVVVDGAEVDWELGRVDAWRAARPFPVSVIDPPVVPTAHDGVLTLEVYLGQLPPGSAGDVAMVSGFGAITPTTTPTVLPVVVTSTTRMPAVPPGGSGTALEHDDGVVVGSALNGQLTTMEVVAEVDALPLVGAQGTMADLETSLVEFEPPAGATLLPQLWAAPDTPPAMLDRVRAAGVELVPIAALDDRLGELRHDAFSLGLRLFLLVGLITLILAVFGVLASAVLQSRWRSYEVASLRVVGVPQRSLVRASVAEYVVMLGVAVVLGLGSALVAVRLVLPTISLGPADEFAPAPEHATQWAVLGGVGLLVFVLAAAIALVVSRRTTRLGRPATLRWAEQA